MLKTKGISVDQLLTGTIPKPTHELKWGESMPQDVFDALKRGETATLLNIDGQPHSLALMDSNGTIRERLHQGCYDAIDAENGGPVHDLSCCGCGDSTGWVAWRDAHAKGWRKFRTNLSTYTICPACRRDESSSSRVKSGSRTSHERSLHVQHGQTVESFAERVSCSNGVASVVTDTSPIAHRP